MGSVGGIAMPDLKLYHIDMVSTHVDRRPRNTPNAAIATRFLVFHT